MGWWLPLQQVVAAEDVGPLLPQSLAELAAVAVHVRHLQDPSHLQHCLALQAAEAAAVQNLQSAAEEVYQVQHLVPQSGLRPSVVAGQTHW